MTIHQATNRAHRALRKSEIRMTFIESEAKYHTTTSAPRAPRWRSALMEIFQKLGEISVIRLAPPNIANSATLNSLARRAEISAEKLSLNTSKWLLEITQYGLDKRDSAALDRKQRRTLAKLARALRDIAAEQY